MRHSLLLILLFIFVATGCNRVAKMKGDADKATNTSDSIMRAFRNIDSGLMENKKHADTLALK